MKISKNGVIVLLALLAVGGAAFSWMQHRELAELRRDGLRTDERAELQKRLWDAEKRAKALTEQLASQGSSSEGAAKISSESGPVRRARGGARLTGPGGPVVTNLLSAIDKPEVQQLMALEQKAQLDGRYAALFKKLGLTPEQLEKFKTLLVEKQTVMQDVIAAAHARGINPVADPEALRKMIAETQSAVDEGIRGTLGDTGFAQYQEYQRTFPQRSLVTQLQQSLSYTDAPLSESQAEQLVGILARTSPAPAREANSLPVPEGVNFTVAVAQDNVAVAAGSGGEVMFSIGDNSGGIVGPGGARITDEGIAAAQGILSPAQVQALQKMQNQQQTQQQLQQTLRQSLTAPSANFGPAAGGVSGGAVPFSGGSR
jgi:hypothetical protein